MFKTLLGFTVGEILTSLAFLLLYADSRQCNELG